MKKILLSLSIFSVATFFCQTGIPVQNIAQPVENAVLYLDGAELIHSKSVTISPGRTNVVFTGLTNKLIGKSVQVTSSSPDVNILSISDKINFLNPAKENAKIKVIRDTIKKLQTEIDELNNDKNAYESEKNMILNNQKIGGNDKGVSIAELKLAADLFRSRIKEINTEVYKFNTKIDQKAELIHKRDLELNELNANKFNPTSEVTILLSCTAKTTTTLELHYITPAGGWTPSYDLKCEDLNKPLVLVYRAKVYNNTGIDWNDIKMKLSTGDPMKNAAKPNLETWFVNYNEGNTYYQKSGKKGAYSNDYSKDEYAEDFKNSNANKPSANYSAQQQQQLQQTQTNSILFEEIQVSDLSAEFDIKEPYTVPSDAKPYIVDVTTHNLNAIFRHYALPKNEREAFMLARITGWEELDLVEGPCNVYFGGTYVGQSYIDTKSIDDTLDLSLGRDKRIMVSRTQVKDLTREKIVGNSRKITYSYEMVVKNNRKTAITIDLEDQLPVSKQADITVEAIQLSGADMNKDNGKLTWTFNLQPDESKKVILTFSIKYPRDKAVNVKNYKSKMRAKF
ncbi:MAG: mucoidy inhibitor MuiA family protein [Bacteroidia bacterium]|nr:mucoidy inhibitor MuiA family protein [Bacteroidia bacterium]